MSDPFTRYMEIKAKYGDDSLQTLLAAIFEESTGKHNPHCNIDKLVSDESGQFFVQSTKNKNMILAYRSKPSRTGTESWTSRSGLAYCIANAYSDSYWLADDADTTILTRAEVMEIYNFVTHGEEASTAENDVENW